MEDLVMMILLILVIFICVALYFCVVLYFRTRSKLQQTLEKLKQEEQTRELDKQKLLKLQELRPVVKQKALDMRTRLEGHVLPNVFNEILEEPFSAHRLAFPIGLKTNSAIDAFVNKVPIASITVLSRLGPEPEPIVKVDYHLTVNDKLEDQIILNMQRYTQQTKELEHLETHLHNAPAEDLLQQELVNYLLRVKNSLKTT